MTATKLRHCSPPHGSARHFVFTVAACVVCLASSTLCDQATGQVVQQPSFRNFSYSGSAWVPDAGTAGLGGNYISRSGSTSRGFGPYSRRAVGRSTGGGSISASVTIIDLQALDEAILNSAPTVAATPSTPANAASMVAKPKPKDPVSIDINQVRRYLSVTEAHLPDTGIRPPDPNAYRRALAGHHAQLKPAATKSQIEADVKYYLEEGRRSERAGQILASRVYYQMAVEAMTPELMERYKRVVARRAAEAKKAAVDDQKSGRVSF